MLKPGNCIVILDLISQAPLSKENEHIITIEKLLVDLIADKTIAATFSPSELPPGFRTSATLNPYKNPVPAL